MPHVSQNLVIEAFAEADSSGEFGQVFLAPGPNEFLESRVDQFPLGPHARQAERLSDEVVIENHVRSHEASSMCIVMCILHTPNRRPAPRRYNLTRHQSSDQGSRDI